MWRHLLAFFRDKDLLVEGPLNNLKQSTVRFAPPAKFERKKHFPLWGTSMPMMSSDSPAINLPRHSRANLAAGDNGASLCLFSVRFTDAR